MRVLVIALCFGLSACSGSLTDVAEPGVSSFPDSTTVATNAAQAENSDEPTVPTQTSESTIRATPEPTNETTIDLVGWTIEVPESWGEPTQFFNGWLRVPGTGSETFADNITAEVVPSSDASDEDRAAAMIEVVSGVADTVTVEESTSSVTTQGLTVLRVHYTYVLSGDVVLVERVLVRGPSSDILMTLSAPAQTFDERVSELDQVIDSILAL